MARSLVPGDRVVEREGLVAIQVVILAAGLGTRLGKPHPKPLTPLTSGESIMRRAVISLRAVYGDEVFVTAVVGFKLDLVIEAMPDISFVYNEVYDSTNTSKSLLKALQLSQPGGVLWLNGDVVFDRRVLSLIHDKIDAGHSFVCVNTASVAEEEVKYTLDGDGYISELSKSVVGGLGEAVGINYVSGEEKAALIARLEEVDDNDYFERGLELAIERDGLRVEAVDISQYQVVEVDFEDDLSRANSFVEG
jgi:CDP-glycerol glycerophosphotransferase